MEICTKRLKLRLWKPEDLESFAKLNADPEVMEYFPRSLTKEESDAFAKRIIREFEEKGYGLFAVEVPEVAPFIGFIGLHLADFEADFTPCVEIGWRLAKEYWAVGYATEGAKAVLDFAATKGIKEIFSFTAKTNWRSIRVMEKLGMEKMGEFDHPKVEKGPLQKHVLYRILLSRFSYIGGKHVNAILNNIFNSGGLFLLSTETKVAGFVASAMIAYSIYLRRSVSETRQNSMKNSTTVLKDQQRTFEFEIASTNLFLEYRGDAPNQANQEFKNVMAKAIGIFCILNERKISHDLPNSSFFKSGRFAKENRKNEGPNIFHLVDKDSKIYRLEVSFSEKPNDSQWQVIERNLSYWRKAFSVTKDYFP